MAESQFGKSFNTELQNVDAKYSWINDMIRARQELVLKYMGILSVSLSRSSNKNDKCLPWDYCFPQNHTSQFIQDTVNIKVVIKH